MWHALREGGGGFFLPCPLERFVTLPSLLLPLFLNLFKEKITRAALSICVLKTMLKKEANHKKKDMGFGGIVFGVSHGSKISGRKGGWWAVCALSICVFKTMLKKEANHKKKDMGFGSVFGKKTLASLTEAREAAERGGWWAVCARRFSPVGATAGGGQPSIF